MSRVPLIAGNWKMYKTVAEAERFIQALLPRVAGLDGVEVAICPPFTALAAMVDSARGSRVGVYAQNMHQAAEGAFTGEVSAPMLGRARTSTASCSATPSGASSSARPTGGRAEGRPPRWRPACARSLCVGETEEERDAGDTERKLRHQVQEGLEHVPPRAPRARS